jgi:hypothetical protein
MWAGGLNMGYIIILVGAERREALLNVIRSIASSIEKIYAKEAA